MSINSLNWILERSQEGIRHEPDQRRKETSAKELDLNSKRVSAELPGEKVSHGEEDEDDLLAGEVNT